MFFSEREKQILTAFSNDRKDVLRSMFVVSFETWGRLFRHAKRLRHNTLFYILALDSLCLSWSHSWVGYGKRSLISLLQSITQSISRRMDSRVGDQDPLNSRGAKIWGSLPSLRQLNAKEGKACHWYDKRIAVIGVEKTLLPFFKRDHSHWDHGLVY